MGLEHVLAAPQAPQQCEGRIEQERPYEARRRRDPRSRQQGGQRRHGERKTEKGAAAVAHEDA
ncbi:MAG: hypothetical protein ABJC51_07355, partial [Acidobacteriota bacterium]